MSLLTSSSLSTLSSIQQESSSDFNAQLTTDALDYYFKVTGRLLTASGGPFPPPLPKNPDPLETINQMFEERANAFAEYRNGNRRLINFLKPIVTTFHRFSGIFGAAASLVSSLCHLVSL